MSHPKLRHRHGREPGLGESIAIDCNHEPGRAPAHGSELEHFAAEYRFDPDLVDGGTRPSQGNGAGDGVVVEVEQVVGQGGVGPSEFGHVVVLPVGPCLVGEQFTDRPRGSQAGQVSGAEVRSKCGVEGDHREPVEVSHHQRRPGVALDVPIGFGSPLGQALIGRPNPTSHHDDWDLVELPGRACSRSARLV